MRLRLLPTALLTILLDWAYVCPSYAFNPSFLAEGSVKRDQVQSVLEHKPARETSCETTVSSFLCTLLLTRTGTKFDDYVIAYRSDRGNSM